MIYQCVILLYIFLIYNTFHSYGDKNLNLTYVTTYGIIRIGGEQMASVDKIVDKMKRQPNAITPDEAGAVLDYYGYKFDRQNGSHKTYVNKAGDIQTIPKKRPTIKPVYVKQILNKIGE